MIIMIMVVVMLETISCDEMKKDTRVTHRPIFLTHLLLGIAILSFLPLHLKSILLSHLKMIAVRV